ncbi:MAG: hypothetical protein ABEJ94_08490 [Halorientalis sp.]
MTELQTAADLPAIERIRAQARDDRGNRMVVVEFANGARLRYREDDDGTVEEWLGPDDEQATRRHERESDAGPRALALEAVGSYLTFSDAARARFVWGEENVATLLAE